MSEFKFAGWLFNGKLQQDPPESKPYCKTALDERKAAADFLITGHLKSKTIIEWKDGKRDFVTRAKLQKLQNQHNWATDF